MINIFFVLLVQVASAVFFCFFLAPDALGCSLTTLGLCTSLGCCVSIQFIKMYFFISALNFLLVSDGFLSRGGKLLRLAEANAEKFEINLLHVPLCLRV